MDFKKSETYKNLQQAYDGERLASTKYRLYAEISRKDGYQQIGDIFDEAAGNEQAHAEIWLRMLNEDTFPMLEEMLQDAGNGEQYEWKQMYRDFAGTADQEGFHDIAEVFRRIGEVERHHDFRFTQLAENFREGSIFCKQDKEVWICQNCGYVIFGKCAPERCPACGYPQGYFKLNCENF